MVESAWPPVSSRRFHFPVSASDMEYREPLGQIERPFQSRKPFLPFAMNCYSKRAQLTIHFLHEGALKACACCDPIP